MEMCRLYSINYTKANDIVHHRIMILLEISPIALLSYIYRIYLLYSLASAIPPDVIANVASLSGMSGLQGQSIMTNNPKLAITVMFLTKLV